MLLTFRLLSFSLVVVELTQNYLKLILSYLAAPESEGGGGVLVHCISGWDRTPLYVSLLRISLWADGAVHQNLNATELLYLTVNYDWFLFQHNLNSRTARGEDIFYFCFFFLTFITSDEFSIDSITETMREQTHQSSLKISIRNDEGGSSQGSEDGSFGSFGSCGRSWEMTGAYLNHFAKQAGGSGCSFLSDNSLQRGMDTNCAARDLRDDDRLRCEPVDDGEEDGMMTFEFEDDDIIISSSSGSGTNDVLGYEDDDLGGRDSPSLSDRAVRLRELQHMMLDLYSSICLTPARLTACT